MNKNNFMKAMSMIDEELLHDLEKNHLLLQI